MEKKRWFVHEPGRDDRTLDGVLLVLWHGAGGDVSEASLLELSRAFSSRGAFAVRARFPYRLAGRRMPDRMPVLVEDARDTIESLRRDVAPNARALILGGRSMGGRVASMLAADGFAAAGLVFLGYPLHPAGRREKLRDAHLPNVRCPMLFIQGDHDALCDLALLRPVLERLGDRATLSLFEGGDHSLRKVAPAALAETTVAWTKRILAR